MHYCNLVQRYCCEFNFKVWLEQKLFLPTGDTPAPDKYFEAS